MNLNFAAPLPAPIPLRYKQQRSKEEFPLDALTDVLRWAVEAIVDKVQCPVELAAMSVLSVASLAAQTHANASNPRGIVSPLSLFLLSVAKSGERKSSADKLAMLPVKEFENQLELSYNSQMGHYKRERAAWEAKRLAILRRSGKTSKQETMMEIVKECGPEPVKPMLPQLTCSEPTLEGLMTQFFNGWPSLGVFSNEGSTFTGGYAMSDEARLKTGAALNAFWDGATVDRNRKSLDESYRLKNRRLALHLMIQPMLAEDFLAHSELKGQGFFSRFLIAWPESNIGTRFQHREDPNTEAKLRYYRQRLLSVFQKPFSLVMGTTNELAPTVLVLDDAAKERWIQFFDYVEAASGKHSEYSPISDFASKMVENALRIAGVMTIVENVDAHSISEDMLIRAGRIMHYFASEQLRVFNDADLDDETRNAELLLNWLHNDYVDDDHITMTEIQQFGPGKLRVRQIATRTVMTLQQHNWLVDAPPTVTVRGRRVRGRVWLIQR